MAKTAEKNYGKNRTWQAILYPENMIDDWQDRIDDIVQLPFAYCLHDKGLHLEDLEEERKVHLHLILVWPNTTTFKNAKSVFGYLSAPGKNAVGRVEPVIWHERAYKYLIHDTDKAREQGKYQFLPEERITGNNYDIGAYIQISTLERNEAFDDLTDFILDNNIRNFADFIEFARQAFPERREVIREVIRGHSGYFEKLVKGCYHRVCKNTEDHERIQRNLDGSHADLDKDLPFPEVEHDPAAGWYQDLNSNGDICWYNDNTGEEGPCVQTREEAEGLYPGEWGPDLLDDDADLAEAADVWGADE